jgi:hypothetical protein
MFVDEEGRNSGRENGVPSIRWREHVKIETTECAEVAEKHIDL